MLLNMALLGLLIALWVPDAARQDGVMATLARVPGLHFALGIASALSSYLNLALLWRWLRRADVFDLRPGWTRFLVRLLLANVAMGFALWYGLQIAPDFTVVDKWQRMGWLATLVGGGALVYALAMLALGFRLRDFREH
jgi:putative peptidoglycan lipid II flippase